MTDSKTSTKTVIRAPMAEERERFYQVYNTGLPNVDEIAFDRFSKWWETSTNNGELEKLWRVAVLEDQIVGIVINTVSESLRWGMIWELAVVPKHRNKGIGTRLIKESERLLVKHGGGITHFAIGVKTHNTRAFTLYEKLGYGVQFLVLRLRGKVWKPEKTPPVSIRNADVRHAGRLSRLVSNAYWSTRTKDSWRRLIPMGEWHVLTTREESKIVGAVSLSEDKKTGSTEVSFSAKHGFGTSVLDAALDLVKTKRIDLWVQDNHQDILEYVYRRGLKRIDSEYLLKKPVAKETMR